MEQDGCSLGDDNTFRTRTACWGYSHLRENQLRWRRALRVALEAQRQRKNLLETINNPVLEEARKIYANRWLLRPIRSVGADVDLYTCGVVTRPTSWKLRVNLAREGWSKWPGKLQPEYITFSFEVTLILVKSMNYGRPSLGKGRFMGPNRL